MRNFEEKQHPYSKADLVAMGFVLADYFEKDLSAIMQVIPLAYDDADFLKNWIAEVVAIQNLPVGEPRTVSRMKARTIMDAARKKSLKLGYRLERMISMSFAPEEVPVLFIETAIPRYRADVVKGNWIATEKMLSGMTAFVARYKAQLTEKRTLTKQFEDLLNGTFADFKREWATYGDKNADASKETTEINKKIAVFYDKMKVMVKDGYETFFNEPEKRKLYTLKALHLKAVPGKTSGGFGFGLYNSVSRRPIVDAVVSVPYYDRVTTSNKMGRVIMSNLPKGTYTVTIVAKGFPPVQLVDVAVKTGVRTRLKEVVFGPEGQVQLGRLTEQPSQLSNVIAVKTISVDSSQKTVETKEKEEIETPMMPATSVAENQPELAASMNGHNGH